jgi:hypothetical protein
VDDALTDALLDTALRLTALGFTALRFTADDALVDVRLGAVVRFRLEEEALPRLIPLVLTPTNNVMAKRANIVFFFIFFISFYLFFICNCFTIF